jgi:drug/metabolite transporter (DMT)-like permease
MSSAAERPQPAPAPGHVRATRLGILAILGPVVAFSLMNIIVKVTTTPALVFAFYRLWLGSAVMLVLLRVTRRRLTWAILRRSAVSGVLFGLNICFFFSALKLTSVADVLIIAALQPALTLLVAGRMFGERVTVHEVAWTGVSLVGVVLVIVGTSGSPDWSLAGDLLAVGALFAWTIYWLRSKRVREEIPAVEYMSAVTFVAALVVTPLALASGQSFAMRWQDLLWLIVFVAGAQIGHSLLAWSHAQVDVSVSSLMILIEPVVSSAAAWLLLGEDLTALTIAGGMVTLLAVGMVIRRATRTTRDAAPPEVAPA